VLGADADAEAGPLTGSRAGPEGLS